ncbi:hypothetical protein V6N13_064998 [Hibiscus sabdariffa]|uniref:Uncharacterized protein n=1 Tax=Hibiscus sabdariffa TaxID=183260 RepID=A0ABR2QS42_9ROSI
MRSSNQKRETNGQSNQGGDNTLIVSRLKDTLENREEKLEEMFNKKNLEREKCTKDNKDHSVYHIWASESDSPNSNGPSWVEVVEKYLDKDQNKKIREIGEVGLNPVSERVREDTLALGFERCENQNSDKQVREADEVGLDSINERVKEDILAMGFESYETQIGDKTLEEEIEDSSRTEVGTEEENPRQILNLRRKEEEGLSKEKNQVQWEGKREEGPSKEKNQVQWEGKREEGP